MIIINMQTSYTLYNFSHPSTTDSAASLRVAITDIVELADFAELADFDKLIEKFKLTEKIELTEKRVTSPQPTPIYILSMTSMAWNISTGQLGLAAWLCSLPASAPLLIS